MAEKVYAQYAGRREAFIRALTVGLRKLRQKCFEIGVQNGNCFFLNGYPNGTWDVEFLPQHTPIDFIPYIAFTVNEEHLSKGFTRNWINSVATGCDSWLRSCATIEENIFSVNGNERLLLRDKIASLTNVANEVDNYYNTQCNICRAFYEENDILWVQCNICEKWFHGVCLNVSRETVFRENHIYCCACKPFEGSKKRKNGRNDENSVCGTCCVQSGTDDLLWLRCHRCKTQYHAHCLNLWEEDTQDMRKFYCARCKPPCGEIKTM